MLPISASAEPVRQGVEESSTLERLRHRTANADPLSDPEFYQLNTLLAASSLGTSMGVEELDGFFTALLAGPPVAKPCHYWPVVLGKDMGDPPALDYIRTTTILLPLLARHWDAIAQTLQRKKVYVPILMDDESGVARGGDWARGFLRAVSLRADVWGSFIASDEYGAAVLPMMILAHEEDPDPLLRPPSMTGEERHEIVRLMAVGVIRAHRYFTHCDTEAANSIRSNLN